MKNLIIVLLSLTIILSFAGCQKELPETADVIESEVEESAEVSQESLVSQNEKEAPAEEEPVSSVAKPEPEKSVASQPPAKAKSNLELALTAKKGAYDHSELIKIDITITNNSESSAAFVLGSGSSLVPDAVSIDGGGLAYLTPQVLNMNYAVIEVKPGESEIYTATYAPYSGVEADISSDIAFFTDNADYQLVTGSFNISATLNWTDLSDQDTSDVFAAVENGTKAQTTATTTVVIS